MVASETAELEAPPVAPSGVAGSMVRKTSGQRGSANKRGIGAVKPPQGVDQAFELWLNRGLHDLYDAVAKEALPADLLKLIEQDKTGGTS